MGRHSAGPPAGPDRDQIRAAVSGVLLKILLAVLALAGAWAATLLQGLTDKASRVQDRLEQTVPGITEQLGQLGRDVAGIAPPTVTVEAPTSLGGASVPVPVPVGGAAAPAPAGTTPIRVQVTNQQPRSSPSSAPSSTSSSSSGRAPGPAAPAPVPCPYPPPLDVLLCPPVGQVTKATPRAPSGKNTATIAQTRAWCLNRAGGC